MKQKVKTIKEWMNKGTEVEVLLRRIIVIGVGVLIIYNLGYAIGTFIAHFGF